MVYYAHALCCYAHAQESSEGVASLLLAKQLLLWRAVCASSSVIRVTDLFHVDNSPFVATYLFRGDEFLRDDCLSSDRILSQRRGKRSLRATIFVIGWER